MDLHIHRVPSASCHSNSLSSLDMTALTGDTVYSQCSQSQVVRDSTKETRDFISQKIELFVVYLLSEKDPVECTFITNLKIVYEGGTSRSRYLGKIFFYTI
jgi:hypothetical protein